MDPRPDDAPTNAEATDAAMTAGPAPDGPVANERVVAGAGANEPIAQLPPTGVGGRGRWLVGGGIAIAAVAGLVLAVTLLAARPLPEALKYAPAGSALLVELRPELPGDQRQHLGNFLAHFPGFKDQSLLQDKIDEALARIVNESTAGQVDYTSQVKPLLAGPMEIALSGAGLSDMMSDRGGGRFLVVATTESGTTCDDIFKATTIADAHRSIEIRTVDDSLSLSCAVHGRFVLVGDAASIRGGLDARLDGKGMDTNATYRSALTTLDGDQLASLYIDGSAIADMVTDVMRLTGQTFDSDFFAPWTIAGVRVLDDAIVIDSHAPPVPRNLPSGAPTFAPASKSRFAEALPAGSLGFVEIHGIGAVSAQALASLRADPDLATALDQLDAALQMLGGAETMTGWIQDVGVAVVPTDTAVGGAVLIRGTDADTVSSNVAQLKNLLILASTGTDITVHVDDHDGVDVISVDLGDLSELLRASGLDPGVLGEGRVQFAFAARGDMVIFAVGDGVVEQILDVEAGTSLGASASYVRAVRLSGETNDVQVYVAINSSLALIERFIPASDLESFNRDLKPYLENLAATSWSSTNASNASHSRVVLTVK